MPWDEGRNFAALGGIDYDPEQSKLSDVAQAAMITNLLTEDNLPSYHREIAENFSQDGAWGTWVGRWTAEENRHGIVMRDYLVVTRGVDPVALEEARMIHMTNGLRVARRAQRRRSAALGRVRDVPGTRDPGLAPQHRQGLRRPDRRPHAPAHRRRREPAHDLLPQHLRRGAGPRRRTRRSRPSRDIVTNFQMPGAGMPNFRRNGVLMAKHGIYDLRQHLEEVVWPVLRKWQDLRAQRLHRPR